MNDTLKKLQVEFNELKPGEATLHQIMEIYKKTMGLIDRSATSIKAGFQGLERHNENVRTYNAYMKKASELVPISGKISTVSYKLGWLEGVASTHKVKDSTFTELKELMTSQIRSQKRALKLTNEIDKLVQNHTSNLENEEQTKIDESQAEIRKQKRIRSELLQQLHNQK